MHSMLLEFNAFLKYRLELTTDEIKKTFLDIIFHPLSLKSTEKVFFIIKLGGKDSAILRMNNRKSFSL